MLRKNTDFFWKATSLDISISIIRTQNISQCIATNTTRKQAIPAFYQTLSLHLCGQSEQTVIKKWPSSYQKREFCGTMLSKETAEAWKWLALWPLESTNNIHKFYPKKLLDQKMVSLVPLELTYNIWKPEKARYHLKIILQW